MLRNYLLLILTNVLFLIPSYGQIRLEKGYFIDNEGLRTECYIRDADWNNNPTSFKYKLFSKEEFGEAGIDDVQEFGTENGSVYIRVKINVDESGALLDQLSRQRAPEWAEKVIFLKTLVKGPATLYLYRRSGLTRFYYQKESGPLTPLVYKRYFDENGAVLSNFGFRQELLNALQCNDLPASRVARLNYSETELEKYFRKYNTCVNPELKTVPNGPRRETFHLKVTPGASLAMMKGGRYTRFDGGSAAHTGVSPRLGLDLEYVLPFNKNKWALMVEPSVQFYDMPLELLGLKVNGDYWSVELPVGVRHYFFLKNDAKLFANALAIVHLKSWQTSAAQREREMEMGSRTAFALGAGVAKGRWSGELRYAFQRDAFSSYLNIDVKYSKLSLILGYRIFAK